ncbi:sensor histidine kinase [Paradevosia shaoguanensis]|uniref:sensor histidine kinase n=1 Tax=Paradevosia shaoguanensis TaxID=1335043 RepID=UPI003C72DB87
MRQRSIATSLFLISGIWLIVALAGTAFLLSGLYSQALDTGLSETLDFHLETLVGRTLEAGDPRSDAIDLGDPRFDRPASGWYWAIRDPGGTVLNLSPSLVGMKVPVISAPFDDTSKRTAATKDDFATEIRVNEREVSVNGEKLRILVTGNLDEIFQLVDDFRSQALIVLGAVGVMLAIMSFVVARIALRPINQLRTAVERVREGESESVTGTFPREIAPLADEVNQLLNSNAQIIERARSQVGNLAHGLKTPLAVLRNEANAAPKDGLSRIVLSESDKMTQLVSTYLDRARLAARTAIVGKKADAAILVSRLARVMQKLHPDRNVEFRRPDASLPWFRGDEGDLEEMAGNLLDNACKWATKNVRVSLVADRREASPMLVVRVEDDGNGLTDEEASKVLRRGVRLDEKTPGSGLGLDIVKELVDVYGGSLQLGRSELGGLRAELRLPAARPGRN